MYRADIIRAKIIEMVGRPILTVSSEEGRKIYVPFSIVEELKSRGLLEAVGLTRQDTYDLAYDNSYFRYQKPDQRMLAFWVG